MSALLERVTRLFEAGHARDRPELWTDPHVDRTTDLIPAAVLIAITEREQPGLLFLHRPATMRAHAGQVAFPGGRIDPGEGPVAAALRESWEELGIDPKLVRVVGTTDTFRTSSGYEITPVVGVVSAGLSIQPNPTEVAQWFEAPLDFVLDPANERHPTIEIEGRQHRYVEVNWQGHRIWGVTGAILHNLSLRLRWHG